MLNTVHHIHGIVHLRHQFEILDTLTDGYELLTSKNNTGERFACCLPPSRFHEKIDILREKDETQRHGAIQQERIGQLLRSVLFRCQHRYTAKPQSSRDRDSDVMIQVDR